MDKQNLQKELRVTKEILEFETGQRKHFSNLYGEACSEIERLTTKIVRLEEEINRLTKFYKVMRRKK